MHHLARFSTIATSLLIVLWFNAPSHAFTSPSRQMMRRTASVLYARDDEFDVEAVRQQLESLLTAAEETTATPPNIAAQRQQQPSDHHWFHSAHHVDHHFQALDDIEPPKYIPATVEMDELPPPPPLTTIERERRLAEMHLLQQLEFGDEALADLWTLWFEERGLEAATRLWQIEEMTSQGPRLWAQVEQELRALIDEHGIRWAEPVNRLATLLYMQGRLEEAEEMSLAVLAVKPWHFGALSGLVMIYAGQEDTQRARQWAARRLPTFCEGGLNRRRFTWVQEAVTQVRELMEEAQDRLRESFGAPDEHTAAVARSTRRHVVEQEDDYDNAWQ